ncbi:MAG: DUF3810 domain-containing protein [Clostridia bacterium]|nr:DUF3810 domain-containing protein [Clostridia bacterium]
MKQIFKLKRIWLLTLFPLSVLLVLLARLNNVWVEKFYHPFIYKPLAFVIGSVVSLFPFSVTEVVFVLLVLAVIAYLAITTTRAIKQKTVKASLLRLLVNTLCAGAVTLFLFELCMGLNYYRYEIKDYLGFEIKNHTKTELYNLCDLLITDMNQSRKQLKNNQNGAAMLQSESMYEVSLAAKEAYSELSEELPVLKAANIRNKPLLSSKLFSMVLTTGIYIPFTFESNINVDVPKHTIPATMCHELTHYRGFMRENEANFLGYLACMKSDRADFKYSASLHAFGYAFTKLYDEEAAAAQALSKKLDPDIITDIAVEDEYWDGYRDTVISDVSSGIYEGYLGSNGQSSGLKSYGEMLDLLLSYYSSINRI